MSQELLQSAWEAARVVLVSGDDTQARIEAVRSIGRLAVADGDMDLEQITADALPVGDWFGNVGTCPFMSDHRTLVVRNVCRVEPDKDTLQTYSGWAAGLPESARLVLVADEEPSDDDRNPKSARALTAWAKVVKAADGVHLTYVLSTKDVPAQVVARVKQMHHSMSKGTADLLVEMVGGRPDAAFAELDKLSLMVEEGQAITSDHLRQMVTPDPDYNVFKLAVAVIEGSPGDALRHLHTMLGRSKDKTGEALQRLFPVLTRQVKLVWQARAAIELGSNIGHPNAALQSCLLQKPNLAGERDFVQQQALRLARRTTFARLTTCYFEVVRADSVLKGQEAGAAPMETLEQMVLRMATA